MTNKKINILVIRLSAMGDVAMTVPVIQSLVNQYPNINITVLSRAFLKPLFDDIENVSFYAADVNGKHKGIIGLYRLFNELKALKFTHIADLHNVLRSTIIRNFFKASGYKVAKIDKGRAEKKALTRTKQKIFKQLKSTHQRYTDVFNDLGFYFDISSYNVPIKPDLDKNILNIIGKNGYKKWIGIAPFATYPSKTYPLDLMEQVIKLLTEEDYQLFLFGGKSDIPILTNLASKYANVISVAGKLNGLKEELNLIANLDLMLSMDSGNAHFAAMKGVKTVTLWGGTHPYAGFAPFNQPNDYCIIPDLKQFPNLPCSIYGNKVCDGYEDAMRSISPINVVKKITTILT